MKEEAIRDLVCPIAGTLIACPLIDRRSPHVFEKAFILREIEIRHRHPLTKLPLEAEDLGFDYEYHFILANRLRAMLESTIDPLFREGIEKYLMRPLHNSGHPLKMFIS